MKPLAESMDYGRICSLWDMVANFSFTGAHGLLDEIGLLVRVSSRNKSYAEAFWLQDSTENLQEAIDQSVESINLITRLADNAITMLKSSHVEAARDRLLYWATANDKRWDDLFTRSCGLRDSLIIELREYIYYAYPKDKGQRVRNWAADWSNVVAAFPEVRTECFNAVDCYALQHPTASVFHSMRVAECGLRALAKERRISLPKNKAIEWATWQEIIRALDDEIKRIGTTWKAGNAKDSALAFYSGARADLNGFKDEYRNLVMHVRDQYDEFQAARALTRVHDFMGRLAEKIDHKRHRIRWGRS